MRILASYFCIDTLRLWRLCVTILSHSHDVQRSNERTNFQLKTAKQPNNRKTWSYALYLLVYRITQCVCGLAHQISKAAIRISETNSG